MRQPYKYKIYTQLTLRNARGGSARGMRRAAVGRTLAMPAASEAKRG